MTTIYPFTLACRQNISWVDTPTLARKVWLRLRAESEAIRKQSWYGLDITLLDHNHAEITVYDIHDKSYGGLGAVIGTYTTVLNEAERELAGDAVRARQSEFVVAEWERREEVRISAELDAIRDEMFPRRRRK